MRQINRRDILIGISSCLGTGIYAGLLPSASLAEEKADTDLPLFLTTCKNLDGTYSAVIFSDKGQIILKLALPGRGHAAAYHKPTGACVTFARRPGAFALAFKHNSRSTGHAPLLISPKSGRHFYGHGVFSHDGKLLYSTENDFDASAGILGVRDVSNDYRHIGEFQSFGIGPHEICMLSDNRTLVVANGGIATHPDSGRTKLNLASMVPNISYIDSFTGDLLDQYHLPASRHQLSIRHMAVTPDDIVTFGCQYQGPRLDQPALIGFHRRGQGLKTIQAPTEIQSRLKNYIGSIAADPGSSIIAASAPRGGLITYWDTSSTHCVGHTQLFDGCGIAATMTPKKFVLTSGRGMTGISGPETPFEPHVGSHKFVHWDNHIRLL